MSFILLIVDFLCVFWGNHFSDLEWDARGFDMEPILAKPSRSGLQFWKLEQILEREKLEDTWFISEVKSQGDPRISCQLTQTKQALFCSSCVLFTSNFTGKLAAAAKNFCWKFFGYIFFSEFEKRIGKIAELRTRKPFMPPDGKTSKRYLVQYLLKP